MGRGGGGAVRPICMPKKVSNIQRILNNDILKIVNISPVYTTLNFWYGTDKIGTRTTFLVLGLPI